MTSQSPLVSVIVVNWNGVEHLRVALPTLTKQRYSPLEILVVDNGSVDLSANVVAENGVTWVGLTQNAGLAHACNQGAVRARGQFLIFLNNDMRFPPGFVDALVHILREDCSVFAADARQLDWDGYKQVHLGTRLRRFPTIVTLFGRGFVPGLDFFQEAVTSVAEVIQASAAAMAVRRSMFDDLGGFDERLPLGWEDTEICWRAWLRGWRTMLVPEAVCWHRVSASSSSHVGAAVRFRGTMGGRLLFATKHLPWPYAASTWVVSLLGFAKDVLTGRFGSMRSRANVVTKYAGFVPSLLSERRILYGRANTSPRLHFRRMLSIGRATQE